VAFCTYCKNLLRIVKLACYSNWTTARLRLVWSITARPVLPHEQIHLNMTIYKRLLRKCRVAASIALVVFSGFAISAKTGRVTLSAASDKIFNLSDFNAVGDGVADDGPAFQRALDALADAGGGTLLIPAGLYLIETPVVKDFSALSGATVKIQGVPSDTMPAPPTAGGNDLAASLDLASEIIPATGATQSVFTISNLDKFSIEHVAFTGKPNTTSDAYITLYFISIAEATVRHCEFYGISTFGTVAGLGGGNIIRAVRSALSIELSVFLGCTANSGAYAPMVENIDWRNFSISNSIFIDYGLRSFYGKMGLGAPLSWINIAGPAPTTPESPRREVVVRDTFMDEGGWVGISAFPHLWAPVSPIDLIYISGLKMNVSNLGTAGHQFYDVSNVLIENSHYGWSRNTGAAIDIYRSGHAILDRLTCIEDADRIRVDDRTERLTVINSVYGGLDSLAQTTTEMETTPEEDPVQFVRQQFLSISGRQPDPAAHFYWSDLLIRCGTNKDCVDQQHSALSEYLNKNPQPDFSVAGSVVDENGAPVSGATINLTGSQSAVAVTESQGKFQFSGLPTSGSYTVAVNKPHYSFTTSAQNFVRPAGNASVAFHGRLNRHSITGRITKVNGTAVAGVTVKLAQSPATSVTTDSDGRYSFAGLAAGGNYTVVPSSQGFVFFPSNITFNDLSADQAADFFHALPPELLRVEGSENALAFDSTSFITQPFSIFDPLGFSPDELTRVTLFAKNLEHVGGPSLVSVVAEDAEGQKHPLEIEFMRDVSGRSWLKQFNVKLSPNLSGKCVQLRLSVAGVNSNNARICIGKD
jgi:hypothetical protein